MRAHATPSAARRLASAGFVLAALGLAGCAQRPDASLNFVPDDYRARHPIIVGEATQDLDILVASSETRLTYADLTRVQSFAARFRASRAAVIRIQTPAGTRNAAAAGLVVKDMVRALGREGVPHSRILVSSYDVDAGGEAFPIRLSFNGLTAALDHPCGQWPKDLGDTYQNRNYENFGCASQANLAAQISDPRDLLGPRGMSEIDAERRTTVIGDYRQGNATASERSRTESNYDW
ncbi:pilus assembly protein CpaD [Aureimonas flava]|uniref:Pilus assembly protein CpaD n=1 Tax=Aureimonas flava TaxID=2320271 RepID=A0A3A1WK24_9HYPH|nr:CpaD family pilus assembly lipoprotein [Aureimonas flava]RIY00956.1 pilus assembly protein CpaD [Aureimonas flava]